MSTDLMTYLNFIANWENATDANVQKWIDEHAAFLKVGPRLRNVRPDASLKKETPFVSTL